jgi:hypothetical protein
VDVDYNERRERDCSRAMPGLIVLNSAIHTIEMTKTADAPSHIVLSNATHRSWRWYGQTAARETGTEQQGVIAVPGGAQRT